MTLAKEITHHHGRLLEEVLGAQLLLTGSSIARYNFSFYLGENVIGIYGIRSFGKKKLRAIRAWNNGRLTWDPMLFRHAPTPGRQFGRITCGDPLFLVEFDQSFTRVVDRIAFRARKIFVRDAELPCVQEELRFEQIDLEDIEILG